MATSFPADRKKVILQQLKQRNRHERQKFESLIEAHSKLFETTAVLKSKNDKLKEENLSLQIKVDNAGPGSITGAITDKALEQKLFKLHEELTDLHRKRGENAQQIIDLTSALKEKEKELQQKDEKLMDALANENSLKAERRHLEGTIVELEATNQLLKDEHQTLQLTYTSLEEKYKKSQEEYSELLARWMENKKMEVDRMNQECDQVESMRRAKLKQELQEAASAQVDIKEAKNGPYSRRIPIGFSLSIPTVAQCTIDAHEGEVNAIQWSTTGNLFASGSTDRKIKLWEYQGGQCTCKGLLQGSNAGITAIEFDLEDSMVLGSSSDYACRIWSLIDHRLRHTLTGHSARVLSAKFLGDHGKVVTGSHDRTLKIWDLQSRACIKTLFAGSSCNDLVTLHGSNIISGHFDKRIRFWDSRSEHTTNEITLQGRLTSLALSPDRLSLLACSRDDTLKVIDLRMNQISQTLCADNFKVFCDWTRAVFSPDASYAVAGSSDGSLFIWNVSKGKVEQVLKGHSHPVVAVSWHPAGSYLLSAEKQKKFMVWSDI